jgi:sulfur carrier protein ThiS adenylyltransferase
VRETPADWLQRNPIEATAALACAHVGIAGCGGLGSNVAVALARTGIGCLTLADPDAVQWSNLNRQHFYRSHVGRNKAEALADVIGDVRGPMPLRVHPELVTESNVGRLFKSCDVVIEAFDSVPAKSMLMKAFLGDELSHSRLIAASGLAGCGTSNAIQTRQLASNIYVCGDLESDGLLEGVMAPRVLLAAAHQANMAVRLICGMTAP